MSVIGNVNAFHSNQLTGQPRHQKLDVMDSIIDIAPYDTPLLATIGRGQVPMDRVVHWVSDYGGQQPTTMTDVSSRNEGDDATASAITSRCFYKNYLHIIGDAKSVTHTQALLQQWGIEDEYYNQQERLAKKLLTQVNYAIMNSTIDEQSVGPNSSGNERNMGGLRDQIITPASYIANGSQRTGEAAYDNHIDAAGGLTTAHMNTALSSMWTNGGVDGGIVHALANSGVKEIVSELFAPVSGTSGIQRRNFGSDDRSIDMVVDVVKSEYCDVHLMLDRTVKDSAQGASDLLDTGDLLFFNPAWVELRVLQDLNVTDLAKVGSSWQFLMEWEGTICLVAPNTAGLLRGIAE